jgi:hypothetical protein
MITRDHHNQTEFLKRCLHYSESAECQELKEEITRLQRDAHCVQRAAWLMAALIVLTLTGLAYATILLENFPYSAPRLIVSLLCALGVGSGISLLAFVSLGMVYRRRLDRRREQCRQMVAKLLESRLGKPAAAPRQEPAVSDASPSPVKDAAGSTGSPASDLNLNPNLNPGPWVQDPAGSNGSSATGIPA